MQSCSSNGALTKNGTDAPPVVWTALRLKRSLVKRHILVVVEYNDVKTLILNTRHLPLFEYVIFQFNKNDCAKIDKDVYSMQLFKCADSMTEIRYNVKLAYKTSILGHTYVINERIPMYCFLKEWYVQSYLEVYQMGHETFVWEVPHVVVFDLDSTLITDELDVRIRDDFVYNSLQKLKQMGCVLVLWSYGSSDHVSHSMNITDLDKNYFDIVLSGGYRIENDKGNADNDNNRHNDKRVIVNVKSNTVYVEKPFYLDVDADNHLPKSPRVVLWHLRKLGINLFKTITLVDDLKINNYSYDFFVHVQKCPEPRQDWARYHNTIVDNILTYEDDFEQISHRNETHKMFM
ncbi:38K [Perigonia lusca single nucleopolyhedrovirus]|uniref:38K n=1 Tax=Perigonia lusca single nucleopolyhedrovirus TaxID=1675865 RepID=A0A0M3WN42_9ABAC|nr:38K [Perigonia lusca single nucleopolyhedrovirus]AKN80660.1 38K [Perigonia lusca single nucleopolyhedrovirus]